MIIQAQHTTFSILFQEDEMLWANFTNSKNSMDKANAAFEESVRDKMFPLFSEFAQCQASLIYIMVIHYIGLKKNILCQYLQLKIGKYIVR